MAVTIVSTTSRKGGNKVLDALSDGTLIFAVRETGADDIEFYYSDDQGASWADTASDITDVENDAGGYHSIFIDASDAIWCLYDSTAGAGFAAKLRRGTYSSGTISWDSGYVFSTGEMRSGDLVAFKISTNDYVGIVWTDATSNDTDFVVVKRTSGGTYSIAKTSTAISGTSTMTISPRIDFHHTGDGKTIQSGTPHFYVGYLDPSVVLDFRFRKMTYSAGPSWSIGTERIIDGAVDADTDYAPIGAFFDGSRYVMVVPQTASPYWTVYDRDAGDTATNSRGTVPSGLTQYTPVYAWTDDSENIYLLGKRASDSDAVYAKYDRTGGSFGSWTQIHAGTAGGAAWTVGAVNHPANNEANVVWDEAGNFTHDAPVAYNTAPTAPTWNNTDNVAGDVAETLTLDWNFTDPDAGDTQSAYTVRRKLGSGGTWNYWTGSAWQASEDATTKIAASGTSLTLAASWGSDGDATHYYGVKTWDAADAGPSPWSADLRVIPSGQDNPTITAPTPTGTPTVGLTATVTWTVSTQTKYRVVVSDTTGGTMDTGTLDFDTGVVVDNITSITASFPTNSVTRYVKVTTWNDEGLASDLDEVDVSVSWTPPSTPTLQVTADTNDHNLDVVITNPGAGATESYNDVYRRVAAVGGDGIRVATNVAVDGTFIDWLVGSGVAYEYLARCYADTGTTADSAWTA